MPLSVLSSHRLVAIDILCLRSISMCTTIETFMNDDMFEEATTSVITDVHYDGEDGYGSTGDTCQRVKRQGPVNND